MGSSYRFQPYRLPDTSYRRVPDAFRTGSLFTARLISLITRIPYTDNQLLVVLSCQIRSDVEGERSETAFMRTDQDIVYKHIRFPIHRTEIQYDILVFPG